MAEISISKKIEQLVLVHNHQTFFEINQKKIYISDLS